MRLAYWTYLSGFLIVAALAAPLLHIIRSNVPFVDPRLWALLGLGFFVERYGAMHIQLYSTTNHIIWHVANGVTGTIYLLISSVLLPMAGVYAFPIGVLVSYTAFYSWYSATRVYRLFDTTFAHFERGVVLPPGAVLLAYTMFSFARNRV